MRLRYRKTERIMHCLMAAMIAVTVAIGIACQRSEDKINNDDDNIAKLEEQHNPHLRPYDSIDAIIDKRPNITPSAVVYSELEEPNYSTRPGAGYKAGYDSCQFFDLRLLKPVGEVTFKPFVYYKRTSREIILKMNNRLTDSLVFKRHDSGWISDKSYMVASLADEYEFPCKCDKPIVPKNLRVLRYITGTNLLVVVFNADVLSKEYDLLLYTGTDCFELPDIELISRRNFNEQTIAMLQKLGWRIMTYLVDNPQSNSNFRKYEAHFENSTYAADTLIYYTYDLNKYENVYSCYTKLRPVDVTSPPYYIFGSLKPYRNIHNMLKKSAKEQFYP